MKNKTLYYKNLLTVSVKETPENLVMLSQKNIPNEYQSVYNEIEKICGENILVRENVYKKLLQAQKNLQKKFPYLSLFVTYGYRSLEIQTKYFLQQLQISCKKYFPDPIDLYEDVHRFIAVPTVAGHPTGGAIDVIIKDRKTNTSLDFGSIEYDFSNNRCETFYKNISVQAKENRFLLRNLLIDAGFAPFDGEWWHFSYGDREWAYYYKKPYAIYGQIECSKAVLPGR